MEPLLPHSLQTIPTEAHATLCAHCHVEPVSLHICIAFSPLQSQRLYMWHFPRKTI